MNDDYLDAFVRESEESITRLNNSLLALESDPDDREAMDQVFRTAHTLKGNFGAMGFQGASDLAHAIEDLLDAIREDELDATPAVMDEVFEGVDRIESILDEIERDGEPDTDVDDQVAALRATLEEGTDADASRDGEASGASGSSAANEAAASGVDGADGDDSAGADDPARATDPTAPPYRVRVHLADSDMPGVDAMLALETAEDAVDVAETDPPREMVEEGSFDDAFVAVVDAADPEAAVDALSAPRQVETAALADGSGAAAPGGDASAAPGDAAVGSDADIDGAADTEAGRDGIGAAGDGRAGTGAAGDGRDGTGAAGDGRAGTADADGATDESGD
ncbi:MAG: Hpt domain-containing protein, partial [Haloferacaceae archaeon]